MNFIAKVGRDLCHQITAVLLPEVDQFTSRGPYLHNRYGFHNPSRNAHTRPHPHTHAYTIKTRGDEKVLLELQNVTFIKTIYFSQIC